MRRSSRVGLTLAVSVGWFAIGSAASLPTRAGSLFTSLGTTTVTPDGNLLGGGFARIYRVAATGRLVVTFNTPIDQPEGGCTGAAHAYKEYTTEMQETGSKGVISCEGGFDTGSLLVGDSYYLVSMHREGETAGWLIGKYDAATWAQETRIFHAVDDPYEQQGDPMVTYVDGVLDVSSQ
jgi:hypothetical protein